MNRSRTQHYADDANLQADVMRFMAIVAFCLVAILAIVRNVEPPAETPSDITNEQREPLSSAHRHEITVTTEPAPALRPPHPHAPTPADRAEPDPALITNPPLMATRAVSQESEPIPVSAEVETQRELEAQMVFLRERTPEPEPEPEPELRNEQEPESTTESEDGLALKFASDSDFLRLLNKGTVTLYAISEDGYQSYDIAHRFVPTNPPKQYHEVVATTVPPLVAEILRGKSVTWAVSLSPAIEAQIKTHLDRASTGKLLINRFAEVQHVSAR